MLSKKIGLISIVLVILALVSTGCDQVTAENIPYQAPVAAVEAVGENMVLNWEAIEDSRLQGYKIVVSRDNPNPGPEDGYLYWITDCTVTNAVIDITDPYTGGDFDYLQQGDTYYFSVTAVYDDKSIPGNALRIVCPGDGEIGDEEEPALPIPQVSAKAETEAVIVSWQEIEDPRLEGYKVVISKNNSCPAYPEDGYLHFITDKTQTTVTIDNKTAYTGGDFGDLLTPDAEYYFSVTAVYADANIPGNAVQVRFPEEVAPPPPPIEDEKEEDECEKEEDECGDEKNAFPAPVVTGNVTDTGITLNWQPIDAKSLQGYKVVISKCNSHPKYPDDGYVYWITDRNKTTAVINNSTAYNGTSDFGKYLVPGEKYYFSVTAVYDKKKVAGNALRLTAPAGIKSDSGPYIAPEIGYEMSEDAIYLNWSRIDDPRLEGYKVVISKNNSNPAYPGDGYIYWITDRNTTTAVIDNSTCYHGTSDFGQYLVPGEEYYLSVTAVYDKKKVAGNALRLTAPAGIKSDSGPYIAPEIGYEMSEDAIYLNWSRIDDPRLQGYKVVISKYNSNPAYPGDGYIYWITDRNKTTAVIDNSTCYHGTSDFGQYLVPGEEYYFSVTAVYDKKKVAGNSLQLTAPMGMTVRD